LYKQCVIVLAIKLLCIIAKSNEAKSIVEEVLTKSHNEFNL